MSFEQDGSQSGVYGQVYDGSGAPVGAEFLVNTYTTYNQELPSAAALAGGGFVVTWASYGQDGSEHGVYGQRYAATIEVTFSLDVTHEALAPGEVVGLRGSIDPLGWESTTLLSDDDGDHVYTGTVAFDAATAGQTLEYKFVHHDGGADPSSADLGAAGGFEGDVGPDVDGDTYANRILTLRDADTALPTVFWDNYVGCTTDAPLSLSSVASGAVAVAVQNGSATERVGLPGCTAVVFDGYTEEAVAVAVAEDDLVASASHEYALALPAGRPGAAVVVEGPFEVGGDVLDAVGSVVAAVVYGPSGAVYVAPDGTPGACGNGPGVRACNTPEGGAAVAAAMAALFGGATAGEGGATVDLAVTAWPNPASGSATVGYGVAEAADVRVSVVDALGREVAVLAEGPRGPGRHAATLDGSALPAGVYVVRVAAGRSVHTARLTVAR